MKESDKIVGFIFDLIPSVAQHNLKAQVGDRSVVRSSEGGGYQTWRFPGLTTTSTELVSTPRILN